jgi:hypothetical protein
MKRVGNLTLACTAANGSHEPKYAIGFVAKEEQDFGAILALDFSLCSRT